MSKVEGPQVMSAILCYRPRHETIGEEPCALDLAESEVARLIEVLHHSGLNYWEIMDIFLKSTCDLHLKATIEYKDKGG